MKNSTLRTLVTVLAAVLLAFWWISCHKDNATSPSESVCKRLTTSNDQPAIRMDSNNISSTISNIQYDQFGRVVSFNFDFKSNTSSERYTGSFSSIARNGLGQITSYKGTVNGENCTWP